MQKVVYVAGYSEVKPYSVLKIIEWRASTTHPPGMTLTNLPLQPKQWHRVDITTQLLLTLLIAPFSSSTRAENGFLDILCASQTNIEYVI